MNICLVLVCLWRFSLTRLFLTSSGFRGINRRLCVIDKIYRRTPQKRYSGVMRHYAKLKNGKENNLTRYSPSIRIRLWVVHRLTAKTNTIIYKVNRRELYCAVELPLSDYKLYGKQLVARWLFTACKDCHSVLINTLWQPFCLPFIGRQFGVNVFVLVVKINNCNSERHLLIHIWNSFNS